MVTNNSANYTTGASGTVLTGNGVGIGSSFQTVPTSSISFFEAYSSAGASLVTGDNTTVTVIFDTTVANVGSDFDTSTYTYTAPYTAYYQFNTTVAGTVLLTSYVYILSLLVNGSTAAQMFEGCVPNPSTNEVVSLNSAVNLSAGDTVTVTYNVSGAISKLCGYTGGRGLSSFSGFLIGT